jgi:DNA-binding IclR family transcriptional regulator
VAYVSESTSQAFRVQSLARGLALLSEVATSAGDLTAAELSRRVSVSRQTAYHLLHTLRQAGFVEQDPTLRYRLGWAVTALVDGYARQVAPPAAALKRLRELAEQTKETCALSAWSGDDIVMIADEPGTYAVRVADIQVGNHGALNARAAAKVLLARCSPERRDEVLSQCAFQKYTDHTITKRKALEAELKRAAETSWAIDNEEFHLGITCVASCLQVDGTDFALTVLTPSERYKSNAEQYVTAVLKAARPI